jgi:hypothetical protein
MAADDDALLDVTAAILDVLDAARAARNVPDTRTAARLDELRRLVEDPATPGRELDALIVTLTERAEAALREFRVLGRVTAILARHHHPA